MGGAPAVILRFSHHTSTTLHHLPFNARTMLFSLVRYTWWCSWFVTHSAVSRKDQKKDTTWTPIPLHRKQLRTEDITALNRHNLNRWAEREHHKHRSVKNYREVVAKRSGAYNASIHWNDIHMPTQSYWASQGFPAPNDASVWEEAKQHAMNGKQVMDLSIITFCTFSHSL